MSLRGGTVGMPSKGKSMVAISSNTMASFSGGISAGVGDQHIARVGQSVVADGRRRGGSRRRVGGRRCEPLLLPHPLHVWCNGTLQHTTRRTPLQHAIAS